MFKHILGPSPAFYSFKKIHSLYFRGGSSEEYLPDEVFFEIIARENEGVDIKPPRMTMKEFKVFGANGKKTKLTSEQKLFQSVIEKASLNGGVSDAQLEIGEETYNLMRKHPNYRKTKICLPFGLVVPFTITELTKMVYASAVGCKSVTLTLPGVIGYSLPAFYFFHMSSYYAPDKLKPICHVLKFTLGGPFWVAGALVDKVMAGPEEKIFGTELPLDVVGTGGTIPGDLGDFKQLQKLLKEIDAAANQKD